MLRMLAHQQAALRTILRSSVVSRLMSSGCAMAGKNGPKENSWMTCETFMTDISRASRRHAAVQTH